MNFYKTAGLDKKYIVGIFVLKVLAGCLYGWLYRTYYEHADTLWFNEEGLSEYKLLFTEPYKYFTNLFENNYKEGLSRVMDGADSFWNDLRSNLISKLLSVFDIFTFGNYYLNCIFFNFLTIYGAFCWYKVFIKIFPGRQLVLMVTVFLFPSFLLNTSGIHRDGLILLGLGMIFYNCFFAFRVDKFSTKRILAIVIGLAIVFLFRNFVLITLLPSLIAWFICERVKRFTLPVYVILYAVYIVAFFNIGQLTPKLDFPKYVSERQLAFVDVGINGSSMDLNPLFPNFRSFMNNAPQALNHSLMRPYITEVKKAFQMPVALQIIAFELLLILFLLFKKRISDVDPFVYFAVFFALSMMLLIGYTIPIIGAVDRYRSVYMPLILAPLVCYTDWTKLLIWIRIKKR